MIDMSKLPIPSIAMAHDYLYRVLSEKAEGWEEKAEYYRKVIDGRIREEIND